MNHKHETTDMDARYVAWFAVALVILGVGVYLVTWLLLRTFEHRQASDYRPTLVDAPPAPTPEPRLQIAPSADYAEQRRQELDLLNSYGWIDKEKGTARIPIERAMQILAERGVK